MVVLRAQREIANPGRALLRLAMPALAATAVVCISATPALAATTISVSAGGDKISDGSVVENNTTLSVKGSTDATASKRDLTLTVSVPGRGSYTLDTGSVSALQSGSLSASVDTACPDWSSSPCVDAVNGSYKFTFKAGTAASSSTVQLRVPPATPTGFSSSVKGTVASFTWSPNTEPDLMGYTIVDDSGSDVTPGGMDADSVCDSSGCGVGVDFGQSARGTSRSFRLIALRHTAPGSTGSIASEPSDSTTVDFPAPPSPSPSSSPGGDTGGGTGATDGSGGGGDATGSGGSGGGGHDGGATGVSGKHPAADLRRSLPTLTAAGAPDLPSVVTEVKPLPQGNYKPQLPYGDQVKRTPVKQHRGVASTVIHDVTAALDTAALWRGLAAAAILMLLAVHLRTFVARVEQD